MNKKPYIILLSIFVIVFILVLGIVFIRDINTKYIIFSDGNHLKYDNKWSVIDNNDIPNKKYKIVHDGLVTESEIEVLDEEIYVGNIKIIGDTIAYRGNNIENKNYKYSDLTEIDYQYLNLVLSQKGINLDSHQLPFLYKYEIDINNDQKLETIYALANHYDIDLGQLFALVMIKNSSIIDFNTFESEFDAYIPYLYFININKKDSIILKNTYASLIGQDIKIISFAEKLDYKIIFEEDAKWN